ncbi:MAG: hypothetical protein ACRDMX_01530 [Solirubrobacteraceae bacterium]
MSSANAAAASAQAPGPGLTVGDGDDHALPAHTRELAARLSALFERDVEIVKRLNDAHHRLDNANERLDSGRAPDASGLIYDRPAAATATSPIAALIPGGEPAASHMLDALKHARCQIHRGFCQYQSASEERRQLAFEVGELSQQLTDALAAAGWSAQEARQVNVHELARAAG